MSDMPRVHGIGGIFFKANDPQALADWYGRHLGLDVPTGWAGALLPWKRADTGADALTVWSPFAADTRYFEPGDKPYMLNFRVDDLDAMMADLRAAGIAVETRAEWDSEVGRFCRIHDPEGNPIELWQPAPGFDDMVC